MSGMTRIRADTTLSGPLAIFSGDSDAMADRKLLVDVTGEPLFEASSLAGALRSAIVAISGTNDATRLFGSIESGTSQVIVHDPELLIPAKASRPRPHRRWRNVIGRHRLVALEKALFVDERWPANLPYRVRIDVPTEDLETVMSAMRAMSLLGLGIGSGPTPITCSKIVTAPLLEHDFSTAVATSKRRWAKDWFDGWSDEWTDDTLDWAVVPRTEFASSDILRDLDSGGILGLDLEVTWEIVEPLKTGRPVSAWDSQVGTPDNEPFLAPVYEGNHLQERYGIAFSGVHGVVRQRAERYLSAKGSTITDDPREADDRLVNAVFGRPGAGRDDTGSAGLLHTTDFLAAAHSCRPVERDRVAIDRLTGGTYRSSKWLEAVVPAGTLITGTISLRDHRLRPIPPFAVAAIAAALRDIEAGRTGLGGGTSVGNGTLKIASASISAHLVTPEGKLQTVSSQCDSPAPDELGTVRLPWPVELVAMVTAAQAQPSGSPE